MKLLNFRAEGCDTYGALGPRGLMDLGARLRGGATDLASMLRMGLADSARAAFAAGEIDYALQDVEVLPALGRGARCFCIGVNYPDRNEEYRDGSERPKFPSIFIRTYASFAAHGKPIVRPRESEQLDYEGEIAVVIGSGGRRVAESDALAHVFGYTCANDGSVRDWLRHSKFNVTQGKNFDRSGSIGPYVVTADEAGPAPLRVTTRVNGEVRQDDTSDRMIFGIPYLIHYVSTFCTLEPGDVLLTGTPSGAGARLDPARYLRAGDKVEVEVSRVGLLCNTVADDVV